MTLKPCPALHTRFLIKVHGAPYQCHTRSLRELITTEPCMYAVKNTQIACMSRPWMCRLPCGQHPACLLMPCQSTKNRSMAGMLFLAPGTGTPVAF